MINKTKLKLSASAFIKNKIGAHLYVFTAFFLHKLVHLTKQLVMLTGRFSSNLTLKLFELIAKGVFLSRV